METASYVFYLYLSMISQTMDVCNVQSCATSANKKLHNADIMLLYMVWCFIRSVMNHRRISRFSDAWSTRWLRLRINSDGEDLSIQHGYRLLINLTRTKRNHFLLVALGLILESICLLLLFIITYIQYRPASCRMWRGWCSDPRFHQSRGRVIA